MHTPHSTETNTGQSSNPETARSLVRELRAQMKLQGSMGFDDFMAAALYRPGLGYYSSGNMVFGKQGDFVTSPELTPLFGTCLATQIAAWMQAGKLDTVVEFGAGSGQLAAQILNALARLGIALKHYQIIELSGSLKARQAQTIANFAPSEVAKVTWLETLPETFKAVVIGNEVLDAMPIKVFNLRQEGLFERRVAWSEDEDGFCWHEVVAQASAVARVQEILAQANPLGVHDLPKPYLIEMHEQAQAWIQTLAQKMSCGVLLLLDYGFSAREYYHPQRDQGTLACHYQHRVSFNPFAMVGEQDITAHVNFTALDHAAKAANLQPLGYSSQARFLLNLGLLDLLTPSSPDYARQAQAVGKLLSEAEMGELFKAIAWMKPSSEQEALTYSERSIGFSRGNRKL